MSGNSSWLKRLLVMMLVVVMMVSLSACSSSSSDSDTSDDTEDTSSDEDETDADETAETEENEETYNVVIEWLAIGNTPTEENLQKIEDAINEITLEAINCTVTLYPVELTDLSTENTLAISTGEKIDLICSVGTGVGDLVDQGLIISLDEYLDNYGADLSDCLGDAISGGYYDGTLYGIPNAYIQSESYGFEARTDLLEKYDIEIDPDKLYTMEELGEIFAIVAEGEGDGFYCIAGNTSSSDIFTEYVGTVDKLGATTASGGLLLLDNWDNTTIENIYASEEYAEYAEYMYEWAQAGYLPSDASSNTESDTTQLMTGNYLGEFTWTTPGSAESKYTTTGYEFTDIEMTSPYKATDRYQNILWSIPITSENPEKAFEFLNLLYADNDIDTMLMYGLEGETYEVIEEDEDGNKVVDFVNGVDATTAPFYCYAGVYGDRLSWVIWTPNSITFNEDLREFNETVTNISPALGYCFVITDEVSSAYSAVTAVIEQYAPVISAGAVDPETSLAEFNAALEAAGIDDIIAANQEQLDAWLAEQ